MSADADVPAEHISFNGINAVDGLPLTSELTAGQLAQLARGPGLTEMELRMMAVKTSKEATLGLGLGYVGTDLASVGWAVVFPSHLRPCPSPRSPRTASGTPA